MNNIDLIKRYKPETEIIIFLNNHNKVPLIVDYLVDNFYDSRFIGFKIPKDEQTHFINIQSIESINIIDEEN